MLDSPSMNSIFLILTSLFISSSIELALEEFDGEFDEFELRLYRINFLSELGN